MIFDRFEDIPRLRYGLIMADPPWKFSNFSKKGEKKSPSAQYECMSLEAIRDLPVSHLAATDCVLWLWTTNPIAHLARDVIEAWGFTVKTSGGWVKTTSTGKIQFGTGYWLRTTGEPYIIATMGKPKLHARNVPSHFLAPARQHSRKPDRAYELARSMAPQAWALDLFSREDRPGWDSFGNEVGKFEEVAG